MKPIFFKYVTLYLYLSLSFFVSCKNDSSAPDYIAEKKTAVKHHKIILSESKFRKLLEDYDKCTKARCRAEETLNLLLRKNKGDNFELLIKAVNMPSDKIKLFILQKLYAYRTNNRILPEIRKILNESSDERLLLSAYQLLLLSKNKDSLEFAEKKWPDLPDFVKIKLIWLIKQNISGFSPDFVNSLKNSSLPQLRALYISVSGTSQNSLESLKQCVLSNNTESPYCAETLGKKGTRQAGKVLIEVLNKFLEASKHRKRRLYFPAEIFTALKKLYKINKISDDTLFKAASETLANRRLEDKIRSAAAKALGYLKKRKARLFLEKFRRDPRKRVGYSVRRAIYLMEQH